MNSILAFALTSGISLIGAFALAAPTADPTLATTQNLVHELTANGHAYDDLRELTQLGPRLSGSPRAAQAVEWAKAKMEGYGFDRVWLQPMSAPHWNRGLVETARLSGGDGPIPLAITALGDSVGTPPGGIEAPVIEVHSLDEVNRRGASLKGKIVFFNRPMDPSVDDTFHAYAKAVDQRTEGPALAAQYGAVAAVVRSMTTLRDDDHPHTGVTDFKEGRAIPAAALSAHAANLLSENLKKFPQARLRIELSAQRLAPVPSYNVIGEIHGAKFPDEVVVVSGHLDSWDLGTGAQDDGAGVVQSIEVLRGLKTLGIRPARTVRAVLFMSEEFGGDGGKEYAKQAGTSREKHIAAIESDRGGFQPTGFDVDGDSGTLATVRGWEKYLAAASAGHIAAGYSGTDVETLDALSVATFGLIPEPRHYFDFHHSALDRIEAVNPAELKAGASAMAVFAYLLAENGLKPVSRPPASR
jgi:Zn-dependent M28 family amino/carboxypeptidase